MRNILLILTLVGSVCKADAQSRGRFTRYGFENDSVFINYWNDFKEAVSRNDTERVSKFMIYPLRVTYEDSVTRTIETRRVFLGLFHRIFIHRLRILIERTGADSLSPMSGGIMLGNGQIWFLPYFDKRGRLRNGVYSINNEDWLYK
jgi:hypothetical protein